VTNISLLKVAFGTPKKTKVGAGYRKSGFRRHVNFDYGACENFNWSNYLFWCDRLDSRRNDKEELFVGLQEGLKLMKPGETVTSLIPFAKAGYYGDTNRIGTSVP
jgi:hypothetical protein